MSKNKIGLVLPALLGAIAFAQAASATVVSYTYSGHIDTGSDQIGLFGQPGGTLDGLDFVAVFLRDDALATTLYQGGVSSYVRGPQAVTAKLTIGGVTLDVGGRNSEQNQRDDGYEGFQHFAAGPLGSVDLFAVSTGIYPPGAYDHLAGPDYHSLTSLTAAETPGLAWRGRFDFYSDLIDGHRDVTAGRLTPLALVVATVPDAAAVPEPATWAMMITGFAGLGAILRRRRMPLTAA
ncbi:MAG TPA: PEPxxWA-CTERM sorting domain-containing protein [Phenylobacterium sp.]